jgi:hypothetical protein
MKPQINVCRRLTILNFHFVVVLFTCLITVVSVRQASAAGQSFPGPADGPGVWMNIWNYPDGAHAEQFCTNLAAHGVRNCFVQTSRSNTDAIAHPIELSLLTQACHHHGIKVIAWSFTQLSNPSADAERLLAAARFKTSNGESIDAIASDMESNLTVGNIDSLGQSLRSALGPSYPLIAIVYSPLNQAAEASHTPWKLLTKYFDIIAPMTYWSGKHQTLDAYTYTCSTIKQIRQAVGKSDVEIQPIGDAMYSNTYELSQFMKACRENEATGISVYPNQKLTAAQLTSLDKYGSYFPPNARFRLAAYRQLRLAGVMPEPPHGDPSSAITRGRFYQLLVSQTSQASKDSSTPLVQTDPYQYLEAHGVAPKTKDLEDSQQFLNSPIGVSEALTTIASLVKNQHAVVQVEPSPARTSHANVGHTNANRHHQGPWLMQSAKAAEADTIVTASSKEAQPTVLNYIEAAQLITQARAGLH